jgi:hypothetical protein
MSTLVGLVTTAFVTVLILVLKGWIWNLEDQQPLLLQSLQRLTYLLYEGKDYSVRLTTYDWNANKLFDHVRVRAGPDALANQERL